MRIEEGQAYLTRCKLVVTVVEIIEDADDRDRYPVVGVFECGERIGEKEFWSLKGEILIGEEDLNDLMELHIG